MLRVSAKVDYAIRALVALARAAPTPVKGDHLARAEAIPFRFLEVTLGELRHAELVESRRGSEGGYWLARPADEITMADVLVVIEGSIIDGANLGDDDGPYRQPGHPSQLVWQRAARNLHELLVSVTIADLVAGPPSSFAE